MKQTSWDPGNMATAEFAAEPPYRGLARYEAGDEERFFGREDITELIAFLAEQPATLPLMLVGASGAGKSSLLRAGLLPRLRAALGDSATTVPVSGERVAVYDLTVTGVPALAADMARAVRSLAAGTRPGSWDRDLPAAVVVDQFEAVFTLCDDEAQRGALITALCEVARSALVVLSLRADCYGRAIGYPGLLRALQERQVVLGPMTRAQVRRVVAEPAALAGVDVAEDLAEVVLADLAPADRAASTDDGAQALEPGALPLLSHALRAAWRQADGGPLTAAVYRAAGGISEALPRSADRAYDSLTPGQRRAARRLLPRLVRVVDGLPPTRQPVLLSDLRGSGDANRVFAAFAAERIVTVDGGTAYFTHDIVLTAWPRLREWIEEDADTERARKRAAVAARAAKDNGAARGTKDGTAARARNTRDTPHSEEDDRAAAPPAGGGFRPGRWQSAGTVPLRRAVAVLGVLVLVAAGLTAYAFTARGQADAGRATADAATRAANSRAAAFVADGTRASSPAVSAQLAAAAYAISPTVQARSAVLDASGAPAVARLADSGGVVRAVSVSPSGKLLVAAGDDGSLQLWDIASAQHPAEVATLVPADRGEPLQTVAFSPDGTVIAVGIGQTVRLWQVAGGAAAPRATPVAKTLTGLDGEVSAVAFSTSGGLLAVGTADGTVRLWQVGNLARPAADGQRLSAGGSAISAVAFGAGGSVLAAGTSAGTVQLWHVPGSAAPAAFGHMPLRGTGTTVSDIAFSPDGSTLAAAGGPQLQLWTVRAGSGKKFKGATASAAGQLAGASAGTTAVAFSPDGRSLAAGSAADGVLVWSTATRALTASVPQSKTVTSVGWAGPQRVAAASADGTVELIALPVPVLAAGTSPSSVAYSADGTSLAVAGTSLQLWSTARRTLLASHPLPAGTHVNASASSSRGIIAVALSDGTVQLFSDATVKQDAPPFPVTGKPGAAVSVAFDAGGTLLATGAADGTVRLYDVSNPAKPVRVATASAAGGAVSAVALAPGGATLAAAGTDGTLRLWSVSAGHALTAAGTVSGVIDGGTSALAFSADGKTVAVGSNGKTVRLWNVADLARPAGLGTLSASGGARSVAFSADGRMLAVGDIDGTVRLWDVTSPARPALTATLTDAAGDVTGVAFSPSGAQLAAADEGIVHLWDTSPAAAVSGICGNLGQALSAADWAGYLPGVPYQAPCGTSR